MKIERGIHTKKHRIRLTLQSEDAETSSVMNDESDRYNAMADLLQEYGVCCLEGLENPVKVKNVFLEAFNRLGLKDEQNQEANNHEKKGQRKNNSKRSKPVGKR